MHLDRVILFVRAGGLPSARAFFEAAGVAVTATQAANAAVAMPPSGPALNLVERALPPGALAPSSIFCFRVRAPRTLDGIVPELLAAGAALEGAILRRPFETVATLSVPAIPGALFSVVELEETPKR